MLTLIKNKFKKTNPQEIPETTFHVSKSADELLSSPKRKTELKKIKRLLSITEEIWQEHYLYSIKQFVEYVQEIPASEVHHHSEIGGLIDHTLDAIHTGIRVRQGYMLPPNEEPEAIHSAADRWTFGVFTAILFHDIGKIVTDLEIVYRSRGGEFKQWHPWVNKIPEGYEYTFRYKDDRQKSLHEKATLSLVPYMLSDDATKWLFSDSILLGQWLSTLTHNTFGGGAIAEIVRQADSASAAKNLGAATGKNTADYTKTTPLHEKLIVSLRKLIHDGQLIMNKPGAAVWTTEHSAWVVSKSAMDAVKLQLTNEGHTGIPNNPVRLFEILREHELLIPNPENKSVWTAEVHDNQKDWTQKLTFLRFDPKILWPTRMPELFDGTITPMDRDGMVIQNEVFQSSISSVNKKDSKSIDENGEEPSQKEVATAIQNFNQLPHKNKSEKSNIENVTEDEEVKNLNHKKGPVPSRYKNLTENILMENSLIEWLLKGVKARTIKLNTRDALIHILDEYILIVSPRIFQLYINKHPLRKTKLESTGEGKPALTILQREFERLDMHERCNGLNLTECLIEGPRKQSRITGYLIQKRYFPSLSEYPVNPIIKLKPYNG